MSERTDEQIVLEHWIEQRALDVAGRFTSTGRHRAALHAAIATAMKDTARRLTELPHAAGEASDATP